MSSDDDENEALAKLYAAAQSNRLQNQRLDQLGYASMRNQAGIAYSAGAAAGRGLLGQLSGMAPGMQQLQQQDMRPYIKDIEKNKRAVAWLETTYPEIHQQWEALYALQESIAKDEGEV